MDFARRKKRLAAALVALVLAGGLFFLWKRGRREEPDGAPVSPALGAPAPATSVSAAAALSLGPASGQASGPASGSPSESLSASAALPLGRGPSWQETDDPARDGWDSEVFSAQAGRQLDLLARSVIRPEEILDERLRALAAADFRADDLRPAPLREVFRDGVFVVRRAEIGRGAPKREETRREEPPDLGGPARLGQLLRAVAERFRGVAEARFQFKIIGVEIAGETLRTRQRVETLARGRGKLLQETAHWWIQWERGGAGEPPRLGSIEVDDHEEVERAVEAPLFSDRTAAVIGANRSWRDQFLRGYNHWLERIQDHRFFAILGTPGLAAGDVNGDGLDDLYAGQESGLPNRLFIQRLDGTAADVSAESGTDWLESTRGVLLVDLDNDGNQDLAAAVLGALVLAAGNGRARFEVRAVLPTPSDTMSLSAADFDRDGDLDIYVCSYKRDDLVVESGVMTIDGSDAFVYHDANDGGRNILYRNEVPRGGGTAAGGPWLFTDATRRVGLEENNSRYSFAAAWEDFDEDGDLDLYVANDFGRNNLYRSEVGPDGRVRFADVAARAGAEDRAASMSASWGDYDRDGRMDIYVGNMFSAAGNRIATQERFKPDAGGDVRAHLRRFARGNTLLRNRGDGTFADVSDEAAVTMGRWAWSSPFVDLNADGIEDLFVANGYITTEDTGDL